MNRNDRLEREREKLYKAIDKCGLNSEEVQKISKRIDKLINEQYEHERQYPECNDMKENYYRCIEILKETVKDTGHFPSVKEWNRYAYNNFLLSNISIEYIAKMNWSRLEKYINKEIK